MKPLVLWCRWHDATLRLHGRDQTAVWGELAFPGEAAAFYFNMQTWELTIGDGEAAHQVKLDEMGVEVSDAGGQSAGNR